MDITQAVTEAVQMNDLIRSGITAAITLSFTAAITGGMAMLFWYWKRKISKADDRGPALYENEHNKVAEKKHGEIIESLDKLGISQTNGFAKVSRDFGRVHERIDETNTQLLGHVQAEASRGR